MISVLIKSNRFSLLKSGDLAFLVVIRSASESKFQTCPDSKMVISEVQQDLALAVSRSESAVNNFTTTDSSGSFLVCVPACAKPVLKTGKVISTMRNHLVINNKGFGRFNFNGFRRAGSSVCCYSVSLWPRTLNRQFAGSRVKLGRWC